jgi:hypothetical protein
MFAIAFCYDFIAFMNACVPTPDVTHWIFTPYIWMVFMSSVVKDFAVLALGGVVKLYNKILDGKIAEVSPAVEKIAEKTEPKVVERPVEKPIPPVPSPIEPIK